MNHCLVFDIGKTNKKVFLFDEDYRIVFEKTAQFPETVDDDGDPCEDIALLKNWVLETARALRRDPEFHIAAVHCATYGASFVHVDAGLQPVAPLYDYLKPFPADLLADFLERYGGPEKMSLETASPLLGHLNSGLQLYWLKYRKPQIFNRIRYALHLPQWVAMLLGAPPAAEMTSIGCHTMLRDFAKNDYHDWVKAEGLTEKFPPIRAAAQGVGLHDSSAALIPYLAGFAEPFVLISTGTWCISLNPFNREPLTPGELAQDCLCYLTSEGKPVKAARYFGGHEHDEAVKKIAAGCGVSPDFYKNSHPGGAGGSDARFQNAQHTYAGFMREMVAKQAASTRLAIGSSPVRRIFVDGGFSGNGLYLQLLAGHFPGMEMYAAEVAQATALGAALAIHGRWNRKPIPATLVALKKFAAV